jgi:hypothetical protein
MYQEDYFNPANRYDSASVTTSECEWEEQQRRELERQKRADKGFNIVYRKAMKYNKKIDGFKSTRTKVEVYTSGGHGSLIRDAETGEYMDGYYVGTKREHLFYKVILGTGECKSANGSSTLFFASPQHYANHMHSEVDPKLVHIWEKNRDAHFVKNHSSANYSKLNNTITVK